MAERLEEAGFRVQESVFECDLRATDAEALVGELAELIAESGGSSVRAYRVCRDSWGRLFRLRRQAPSARRRTVRASWSDRVAQAEASGRDGLFGPLHAIALNPKDVVASFGLASPRVARKRGSEVLPAGCGAVGARSGEPKRVRRGRFRESPGMGRASHLPGGPCTRYSRNRKDLMRDCDKKQPE